jgi:hypothetical protein
MNLARTPDGRRLEVDRTIAAAPERAWEVLITPARWPEWGPSVRGVDCEADRIAAGTTGRVQVPGGLWIPFEITGFRDLRESRGGRWAWRVAKIPATGHRVESTGEGCRVVFEIPLAAAGYAVVCSRALDRIETLLD